LGKILFIAFSDMVFTRFLGRTGSRIHSLTHRRTNPIKECLRYRFSTMTVS